VLHIFNLNGLFRDTQTTSIIQHIHCSAVSISLSLGFMTIDDKYFSSSCFKHPQFGEYLWVYTICGEHHCHGFVQCSPSPWLVYLPGALWLDSVDWTLVCIPHSVIFGFEATAATFFITLSFQGVYWAVLKNMSVISISCLHGVTSSVKWFWWKFRFSKWASRGH
jgi:hypothetical protein